MLSLFEQYKTEWVNEHGNLEPDVSIIKDNVGICLYLWQSCVAIVLKFLDDKHFLPEAIKKEYDGIQYQLSGFRDCVFHVQDTYMTGRHNELFKMPDAIAITRHLHDEIGKWLKSENENCP